MRAVNLNARCWCLLTGLSVIFPLAGGGGCGSPSSTSANSGSAESGKAISQNSEKTSASGTTPVKPEEEPEVHRQLEKVIPSLPTFRDRAKALHALVTSHPDAKIDADARRLLEKWLKDGVAEKPLREVPDKGKDVQEAETTDGTLLIGKFEPDAGYIKYWPKSGIPGTARL